MEPVRIVIFEGDVPLPSPSPACLKALTFLRMAGVPYEVSVPTGPPRSSTGKVPYLERPDGTVLPESQAIIEALTAERSLTLDAHLSPTDRATALAYRRMIEDHLYFALLARRWIDGPQWPITRARYFGSLPGPLRLLLPPFLRRRVLRDAWGQGLARRPLAEVYAEGAADVRALAVLLGDRDWFFGQPSSFDATAYGTLAQIALPADHDWPVRDALLGSPGLVAWLERVRATWWSDRA